MNQLLTNPLYWIIMFIFLIIIISYIFFYPKLIGLIGEHWTKQELRKLPKDKYKLLNNIMISVNGKTHQIDHILVSEYGIFVIETKQYNGYITGGKYDKNWVRHIGKKKIYYTNPIRQNYGHVKSICELLNIDESMVFNIVCIPSTAKLKIKHDGELVRNININKKILSYNKVIINDVDNIVDTIVSNNIKDKEIKKEHISNIKNKIDKDINKCPLCGNNLIEKKGKYGIFIGCSNYPRCKYTRNDINRFL